MARRWRRRWRCRRLPNVVLRDTAGVFLIEDCKKLAWSCNKLLLRHAPLSRDIKIIEIRLCKDQANAFDNFKILRVDEAARRN
jgi:hypothetical protein